MTATPKLQPGFAYVWRVALDDAREAEMMRPLLSDAERARADRFYTDELRTRYITAHAWTRRILAHHVAMAPEALAFQEGSFGKPSLWGPAARAGVHFNLAHAGGAALIALSQDGPIGVDIERWDCETDHLQLAEEFFSPAERSELRSLAGNRTALIAGFFAAWTRKEAYLKATGDGITRGLHHFDVSLSPGIPARLIEDRMHRNATREWAMDNLPVGEGFSGAVVARAPLNRALLFDGDVVKF